MPALHSVLQFDGVGGVIEALVDNPELVVNGRTCQTSRLRVGDVIAVGGFEFAVRAPDSPTPASETAPTPSRNTSAGAAFDPDDERALYSAAELVDLIEAEVHRIEDYQSGRELGAEALLQEALRRAAAGDALDDGYLADSANIAESPARAVEPLSVVASEAGDVAEPELQPAVTGRVEEIVALLEGFSEQLERRSKKLAEHEAGYLEASLELLKAQQRLADHLDVLHKQIERLETSHSKTLRASA